MDVLKIMNMSKPFFNRLNSDYRVKASTLMETLVATVLIVIIFMMASMILNNLFSNTLKKSTRALDAHINELHYLYSNEKLILPHHEDYNQWYISVTKPKNNNEQIVLLEAENTKTNQKILKEFIEN